MVVSSVLGRKSDRLVQAISLRAEDNIVLHHFRLDNLGTRGQAPQFHRHTPLHLTTRQIGRQRPRLFASFGIETLRDQYVAPTHVRRRATIGGRNDGQWRNTQVQGIGHGSGSVEIPGNTPIAVDNNRSLPSLNRSDPAAKSTSGLTPSVRSWRRNV